MTADTPLNAILGGDFDERFLRHAIELSTKALETEGTEPFAAVIVKDGKIVGEGINRSVANHDPTSHGEIEAIREACRRLGTVDLRGTALYASCEPCAMCVAATLIAGIERLFYAAALADSNLVLAGLPLSQRFTVDANKLRRESGKTVDQRQMPAFQALSGEALAVVGPGRNKCARPEPDRALRLSQLWQ